MKRFLLLGLLASCSASTGSHPDANEASIGGAVLVVDTASAPLTIASISPPVGTTFLVLDVTLQNTSSATPLPSVPALFSLATDHQLVLMIAPEEGVVTNPCTGGTSVATGGSLACSLAFRLPTGQLPKSLHYDDVQGQSASAGLPVVAQPDVCVVVASYGNLASQPCMACLTTNCGTQQDHVQAQCATSDCAQCSLMAPDAMCTCAETCERASCWIASEAMAQCIEDDCTTQCM